MRHPMTTVMAPITQTEQYLARLKHFIEPAEILEKKGFTTRHLSNEELLLKRRCSKCNKTLSQLLRSQSRLSKPPPRPTTTDVSLAVGTPTRLSLQETLQQSGVGSEPPETVESKPHFVCKFHPGTLVAQCWTCCGRGTADGPCSGAAEHVPRPQELKELSLKYQFHHTPLVPSQADSIRSAVAIDCEMGTATSGDSELIQVTLIDYFSEEILIHNLVEPDVPMKDMNTRFSGVSWADMKSARRNGTCLRGKAGARKQIWKYVGTDTIVIGHGVSNDMRALRWIHELVVDSLLIETKRMEAIETELKNKLVTVQEGSQMEEQVVDVSHETIPLSRHIATAVSTTESAAGKEKKARTQKPGSQTLKALAKKYLERDIQTNSRKGHDCLEDAVAARDLVHWNVLNHSNPI